MIKFKEIRLYPTHLSLDIWVTDNPDSMNRIFINRYGMTEDELSRTPINDNECMILYTEKGSELNGEKRFVIVLENNKDIHVVVHELTHLKYQLSGETGIEINKESQEWQAYFMDYVTEQILKDDYDEKG